MKSQRELQASAKRQALYPPAAEGTGLAVARSLQTPSAPEYRGEGSRAAGCCKYLSATVALPLSAPMDYPLRACAGRLASARRLAMMRTLFSGWRAWWDAMHDGHSEAIDNVPANRLA